MDDYDKFLQLHHSQLQSVPRHLWRGLHHKLQAEVRRSSVQFLLHQHSYIIIMSSSALVEASGEVCIIYNVVVGL